jgi:hypothetical protein
MVWLKRNLSLAISGFLALGLLGYSAWNLYSALQKNTTVNGEIEQTKREIERLLGMPITPNASNLANAQRELKRVTDFNGRARKHFPPAPEPPSTLTSESFKTLLQTRVNELHQQAAAVGIAVEPNYYFTFESHRGSLEFQPQVLRPLYDRLHEVQSLCHILLKARVNRLVGFRRAAVPGEKQVAAAGSGGAGDYLNASPRPQPDVAMTMWPYEVTFDCFTSQLGAVLEALERIDEGFMVKALTSEPAPDGTGGRGRPPAPPTTRTNMPGRPPGALETVINEKLLRVTLYIEVVRPDPPGGGGGGRPGRPTP